MYALLRRTAPTRLHNTQFVVGDPFNHQAEPPKSVRMSRFGRTLARSLLSSSQARRRPGPRPPRNKHGTRVSAAGREQPPLPSAARTRDPGGDRTEGKIKRKKKHREVSCCCFRETTQTTREGGPRHPTGVCAPMPE